MARVNLTAGRLATFTCPGDKAQAFLWDTGVPGLGIRATPRGSPAYIFQREFGRITIGAVSDWSIPDARERGRELQRQIDQGRDPRLVKAERRAADVATRQAAVVAEITVSDVWPIYLADRKSAWGDRHYGDHGKMAQPGGVPAKRGTRGRQVTIAGPLHALMALRLADVKPAAVEAWAAREAKTRASSGRLALRIFRAFLSWCSEHPEYATLVQADAAKSRRAREHLGKPQVKDDVLLKEQLPAWFAAVRALPNSTVSAYLQVLLLTGARRGEVLELKWADIDKEWNAITIRDKVEGTRRIPLTPHIDKVISALPHRRNNPHVFASSRSEGVSIADPRRGLDAACKVAKINGLTLHGLRRSFSSLTEWLEVPAGVVAQLQGHKPSATAERHYKRRPLDLLRVHHERIEAWILAEAQVANRPATVAQTAL